MSNVDKSIDANTKAMADALANAGIVSDVIEPDPDPHVAARKAYLLRQPQRDLSEFTNIKKEMYNRTIPRVAGYRQLAVICRAALRRGDVPNDMIEEIAFAWGYWTAKVEQLSKEL